MKRLAAHKDQTAAEPRARQLRTAPVVVVLLVTIPVSIACATSIGATHVPMSDALAVITDRLSSADASNVADTIIWNIRLPRVLLAAIVGAGLSLAGTIIQTLVRNPLADPFLLGISSGAGMGASAVITLGVFGGAGLWALSLGALVGSLAAAALVFGITLLQGGLTPLRLVLTGTVLSSAFSAVSSYLIFRSAEPQAAQSVLFWLLGSLSGADWNKLLLPLVAVLGAYCVSQVIAGWLDALATGVDAALSLGVPVRRLRTLLFIMQSVLVGVIVAVSGGIGFVGLVVPHMSRILVGARHRSMLPVSLLLGALLMIWVDAAARVMAAPMEVPLSVVTGLVGAPVFLLLLGRRSYRFGDES